MRYFELPQALLLAVFIGSAAAGTRNGHRVLRAATKRSDLLKRDVRISQKFESEVVYVEEENSWSGKETFASSVKVGSKEPILSLEEIEHHLQDVECGNGRMKLYFVDAVSARDARAASHGGLVITSHQSCNADGERAVYKVEDVSYIKEGVALDLAVTEALWQDAFENLDINFGHTRYDHIYRRHSDFSRTRKKRQDELNFEIPANTLENITDVSFDLEYELLDTVFTADDFLTGLEGIVAVPGVVVPDLPIEIGCKNCSTRGQITLTQGAIKIDTKQLDFVPDFFEGGDDGKDMTSVISGGYMDLAVTGVGARLEMFARPVGSGSYEIALPPLPVLGFVIPGIGQAGASFEPRISAEFEVDGELDLAYGIDVAIPDTAGIKVELGNLKNTTITGIKGATLKALPFTSNVADVDAFLSLAFTPTIPIGFEFSDQLSALVTMSLELPRLDARLTADAGDRCKALDKGRPKPKPSSKPSPKPKGADPSKLVLVEANITVVIDVSADLTLPLLPAPFDTASTSAVIFSTELPLMTSCVTPTKGKLKITSMAPVATLTADKAGVQAVRTKHEDEKPCTCATATTTVYAPPPTGEPPVTSGAVDDSPPISTSPPLEMTPYYPAPPVSTSIQEHQPPLEMTPYYPDAPPASAPTGGYIHGPDQPPALSKPCNTSQTLHITMSTPPASIPSSIIISTKKPCTSNASSSAYTYVATFTSTSDLAHQSPPTSTDNGTHSPSFAPAPPPPTNSLLSTSGTTDTSLSTPTTSSSPPPPSSSPSTPPSPPSTSTPPPSLEESKGFLAPPDSTSPALPPPTPTPSTVTTPPTSEFSGAAVAGYAVPGVEWISVLGLGVGVLGAWV